MRRCLQRLGATGAYGGSAEHLPILTAVGVHLYRNVSDFIIERNGSLTVEPDGGRSRRR